MSSKQKTTTHFGVWERHQKVFALIESNPSISANALIQLAAQIDIKLSLSSAYRLLTQYWRGQKDVEPETRTVLPTLITILQNLPKEEYRTVAELHNELNRVGINVHISSVYRELKRLVARKSLSKRVSGRITGFRWNNLSKNC